MQRSWISFLKIFRELLSTFYREVAFATPTREYKVKTNGFRALVHEFEVENFLHDEKKIQSLHNPMKAENKRIVVAKSKLICHNIIIAIFSLHPRKCFAEIKGRDCTRVSSFEIHSAANSRGNSSTDRASFKHALIRSLKKKQLR